MNTVFIWIVATATINFSLCSSAATNWGLLLLFSSSTHSNSVLLSGAETSLDKDYMQWCLGVSLCSALGTVLLYALLCVSFFSKREVSWRVSETLRVVYTFKTSCRSERFCYLLWYALQQYILPFTFSTRGREIWWLTSEPPSVGFSSCCCSATTFCSESFAMSLCVSGLHHAHSVA